MELPATTGYVPGNKDFIRYGEMLMIKSSYDEQKWAARREQRGNSTFWLCGRSYVDLNMVILEPVKLVNVSEESGDR